MKLLGPLALAAVLTLGAAIGGSMIGCAATQAVIQAENEIHAANAPALGEEPATPQPGQS